MLRICDTFIKKLYDKKLISLCCRFFVMGALCTHGVFKWRERFRVLRTFYSKGVFVLDDVSYCTRDVSRIRRYVLETI